MLGHPAQRLDDLVEGQHEVDVAGLQAQCRRQPGEHAAAARAQEVVLRVVAGKAGVPRDGHAPKCYPSDPHATGQSVYTDRRMTRALELSLLLLLPR